MTASVTTGRALRYAGGSARGLLHQLLGHGPVMMHRGRSSWLRTWAAQIARRRGSKRAMVALARRIGVILHRMWIEDADFRADGLPPKVV